MNYQFSFSEGCNSDGKEEPLPEEVSKELKGIADVFSDYSRLNVVVRRICFSNYSTLLSVFPSPMFGPNPIDESHHVFNVPAIIDHYDLVPGSVFTIDCGDRSIEIDEPDSRNLFLLAAVDRLDPLPATISHELNEFTRIAKSANEN
tara:strand:+ start:305 stop:745 length:441 start_codon:yes stop_codon:yes gene_type:complete